MPREEASDAVEERHRHIGAADDGAERSDRPVGRDAAQLAYNLLAAAAPVAERQHRSERRRGVHRSERARAQRERTAATALGGRNGDRNLGCA